MKRLKLNLFLLIVSTSVHAQEVARGDYQISENYVAGEYLIYDCQREFFACVNLESNESCQVRRNNSIKLAEKKYPCAPLKKFNDKRECVLRNYSAIETAKLKRFCFAKTK
jgi:hypothetical protein